MTCHPKRRPGLQADLEGEPLFPDDTAYYPTAETLFDRKSANACPGGDEPDLEPEVLQCDREHEIACVPDGWKAFARLEAREDAEEEAEACSQVPEIGIPCAPESVKTCGGVKACLEAAKALKPAARAPEQEAAMSSGPEAATTSDPASAETVSSPVTDQ